MALAALLVGCGKPSFEASCRRAASVQCRRSFECARAQAEAFWGTESNCLSQFNNLCEAFRDWECDDVSAYERCISEQASASCSTFASSGCSTTMTTNCRPKGSSRVTCAASNVNSQGNTCTVTLSQCSDGRAYTLSCNGSACTCNDGNGSRSVTASCSGVSPSSAISTCGWNVQR